MRLLLSFMGANTDMLYITANYANRNATNQFFQGTKIRFKTTVDGLVRVYFRATPRIVFVTSAKRK